MPGGLRPPAASICGSLQIPPAARAGGIEERSEPYPQAQLLPSLLHLSNLDRDLSVERVGDVPEDDPVVALRSVVGGTVQFRLDSMASCSMNDPSGVALARRTWLSIWQRAL